MVNMHLSVINHKIKMSGRKNLSLKGKTAVLKIMQNLRTDVFFFFLYLFFSPFNGIPEEAYKFSYKLLYFSNIKPVER